MNKSPSFQRRKLLAALIAAVVVSACRDSVAPDPLTVYPPRDTAIIETVHSQAFVYTPGEGMIAIPDLPGATYMEATGINDGGEVVGYALVRLGARSYPLVNHGFFWSKATGTIDIGTLPGAGDLAGARAQSINANGQVVGWSFTSDGRVHAIRWTREKGMIDLGVPEGASNSYGFGINAAGDVVGQIQSNNGIWAFRWTDAGGFVYAGNLPEDRFTSATGINDSGFAIGSATPMNSSYDDATGAMRWSPAGDRIDIVQCEDAGCLAYATGINQAGDVVGYSSFGAFHWSAGGGLVYLPGGAGSVANGINDAGQVVGSSSPIRGSTAVLWNASGEPTVLGVLPGHTGSVATAINNQGQVAGYSF